MGGRDPDVVRAHYTDLHHREVARVHPRERLRQLRARARPGRATSACVRRGWRTMRDV